MRKTYVAFVAAIALLAFTGGVAVSDAAAKPSRATVIAVQKKLGIPADGVVGPQTKRAVKRFQRRNGLAVDGVIGPETLRAMGIRARGSSSAPRRSSDVEGHLERIAQCESGGNPRAVSPDGRYRGKYQFSRETWRAMGGEGDPAKASEAEQDRLARLLYERQGPSAWPSCA